jgi:hypothetical protein
LRLERGSARGEGGLLPPNVLGTSERGSVRGRPEGSAGILSPGRTPDSGPGAELPNGKVLRRISATKGFL